MQDNNLKIQRREELSQRGEQTRKEKYYIPAVDIYETPSAVTIIAEMPGVTAADLEITLEDDVLSIHGRNSELTEPAGRILLQEYEPGNYLRRFTVAESIDQDRITASLTDGLLRVELPKAAPARPRRIEVREEGGSSNQ
ncbi:MAG: Hsp20/alpha crystallin family protein [Desulfobulbaceae bacterium]